MIKKIISLLLLVFFTVFSAGCKSYRETENVYIVTAIGFDCFDEYRLTAEVVSAGGNEIQTEPFAEIYESTGASPEDALYTLRDRLPKSLMFNHCTAVIIGGRENKKALKKIFKFCEEMVELNLSVYMLKAEKAADIINNSKPISVSIGFDISGLISEMEEASGIDSENRFYLCNKSMLFDEYFTVPFIKTEKEKIKISGSSLYKGGSFITDLTVDEGFIFSVLSNKSRKGVFLLDGTRAQVTALKTKTETDGKNQKYYLVDMYISKEMNDFCGKFEKKATAFLQEKGTLAGLKRYEVKVKKKEGI